MWQNGQHRHDTFLRKAIPERGRAFPNGSPERRDYDADTARIDEYLAKSFFGNEDPVGKAIQHNNRGTIIGVAGTVAQEYLGQAPHPMIYHYFPHNPWLGTATIGATRAQVFRTRSQVCVSTSTSATSSVAGMTSPVFRR